MGNYRVLRDRRCPFALSVVDDNVITNKASCSLRKEGKWAAMHWRLCRIKENFPQTQPWHYLPPSWRAHAEQPELKPHPDTMNDIVFYFPSYFLLRLLFRSFLSAILPTFSKLITCCHFLKKEKRFYFLLCVSALEYAIWPPTPHSY